MDDREQFGAREISGIQTASKKARSRPSCQSRAEQLSRFALLLLLFFLTMPVRTWAQSPEKIIDEYLRAEGGAKKLQKIRTAEFTGTVRDTATGARGTYTLLTGVPNKLYVELILEPERIAVAYNGQSAWAEEAQDNPHTLTGAAAARAEAVASYLNSRLANYKKEKIVARFVGMESIASRPAYHLDLSLAPGVKREVFFDAETHLIVREAMPSPSSPADPSPHETSAEPAFVSDELDYSDYRPVDGVPTPFHVTLRRDGHVYEIAMTHVALGGTISDSAFNFPAHADRPLPDAAQLLLDVAKNQRTVEELLKQYTCRVTEVTEKGDSSSETVRKTTAVYDVYYIGDEELRHMIAKNGKPLEGDEKQEEDERFSKKFDELKKKQAELAADPKKQEKQNQQEDAEISDFLRAEKFTNARRERFRGQDVIVFDFAANPAYKPKKLIESFIQKLVGVMWVDEQARDVARLEAVFSDNVKIGGGILASLSKGSNFVFEQTLVNGEVWLPSYTEVHAGVRLLFLKLKANEIDTYSDYKKFQVDVKIGATTPLPNSPQAAASGTEPASSP
jgi:hypothetical protein